jgi:ATP synthase mitochondrial F1 complex assembly factor 2
MLPEFLSVEKQKEKIDPILEWVDTEFGFKPVVYTSFFGGSKTRALLKL